jgi:hypothetical protein
MVGMRAALYAVLLIGVLAAAPLIALRLWLRATQPASTT